MCYMWITVCTVVCAWATTIGQWHVCCFMGVTSSLQLCLSIRMSNIPDSHLGGGHLGSPQFEAHSNSWTLVPLASRSWPVPSLLNLCTDPHPQAPVSLQVSTRRLPTWEPFPPTSLFGG